MEIDRYSPSRKTGREKKLVQVALFLFCAIDIDIRSVGDISGRSYRRYIYIYIDILSICEFCMKIQRRSVTICAFQHFNFLTAMEKSRTVSLSHTEKKIGISFFFVLFFFPIPFIILALRLFLPSSCNSDPGSHSRLFSPPTHYGSCLAFLSREDFCSFFLVDSRRIVLTHARRSQQLILFYFVFANQNSKSRICQVIDWKYFPFLLVLMVFLEMKPLLNKNDFIELYS